MRRVFKVEIEMENAPFVENEQYEVARILDELQEEIKENGVRKMALRDYYGNIVGHTKVIKRRW